MEQSYQKLVLVDSQPCTLHILDTGGQYRENFGNQWIEGGEGFVLVYSITCRESFQLIRELHSQIWEKKKLLSTGNVPVMVVGNKSDEWKERAVSYQEGSALAEELGCKFSEVSAQGNQNVDNVFYDVAHRLRRQRQQCNETPCDRGDPRLGDPRLFMESVGGSKRNCGFCLTGLSVIRQFITWLRSNVGPSKHMT